MDFLWQREKDLANVLRSFPDLGIAILFALVFLLGYGSAGLLLHGGSLGGVVQVLGTGLGAVWVYERVITRL